MADIIKSYIQGIPAARFVGTKYRDEDRINGSFGAKWGEWFGEGRFAALEILAGADSAGFYEDSDACIGLMRWKENEPFEYWIGMFAPANTPVPDGFSYVDFPAAKLGVCWLYGPEYDLYGKEFLCAGKLMEQGYELTAKNGAAWFFERYASSRFTTPDKKGNVILDICHYIK